ncbi:MAG TPA: Ada metal-binding domain-containing protein [Nitrospira sp.]|nr:Ada metal-binding domain-containing protein [Nitrospira sp.]
MNSQRHDRYYQAVLTRDVRFDGKFFVGVKTTGVYCRPICPARPKRENVEFFNTAKAAEQAGYRPCLRCRPESAPGSPAWNGKHTTIERALKLMAQRALERQTEDAFAERLGMTGRHLRRLFQQKFGQTPKQLSDTSRLNFAKKLIIETHLPMTEIAYSAGFHSLRRFNDAVKRRFHCPPSALRLSPNAAPPPPMIQLSLPYRPPFDWDGVLDYYRRHRIAGLETIETGAYARLFMLRATNTTGFFRARAHDHKPELLLEMTISDNRYLLRAVERVRQMFDLDSHPGRIAQAFAGSPFLSSLHAKFPGARVAQGFDPFETAIGTILGQVVSVTQAARLMGELVAAYGEETLHPLSGQPVRLFPSPRTLAQSDLKYLNVTRHKRTAIREFASRAADGMIDLERIHDMEDFKLAVQTVNGIGPWSAEYIALRALGDTDAFPATDLVIRRFLESNPKFYSDTARPWRSYLSVYLWNEYMQLSRLERKSRNAVLQAHTLSDRPADSGGGQRSARRRPVAQRAAVSHQIG